MKRPQYIVSMLQSSLEESDAHADFEDVFKDVAPEFRGKRIRGLPYSLWDILEHIRIAQWDIVEYSKDTAHSSPKWPDEYWPPGHEPASEAAWKKSLSQVKADRKELKELLAQKDISEPLKGAEATLFREALLVLRHTSYHLGQAVLLRRLLGTWSG